MQRTKGRARCENEERGVLRFIQMPFLWETAFPFYIWWVLKLSVKWKWTVLRDCNICSCSGPHYIFGSIKFLEANESSIEYVNPWFALDRPPFDGPNALSSSRPWTLPACWTSRTACQLFIHPNVFARPHTMCIIGQGLSSSSINWPLEASYEYHP